MPRHILQMFMMPLFLALLWGCREDLPYLGGPDAGVDVGDASGEMGASNVDRTGRRSGV